MVPRTLLLLQGTRVVAKEPTQGHGTHTILFPDIGYPWGWLVLETRVLRPPHPSLPSGPRAKESPVCPFSLLVRHLPVPAPFLLPGWGGRAMWWGSWSGLAPSQSTEVLEGAGCPSSSETSWSCRLSVCVYMFICCVCWGWDWGYGRSRGIDCWPGVSSCDPLSTGSPHPRPHP